MIPCAIAGADNDLAAAAAAVATKSTSRCRRLCISFPLAQRQSAGVAVSGFRQLAPVHDAGEERHVAVVDPAGQRVLGADFGKQLPADLGEYFEQFVAEPPNLDPAVGAQDLEPLDV